MEAVKQTPPFRSEYPRPQFVRKQWMTLNGSWDFRFAGDPWQTIEVPFVFQSRMSGIDDNRMCDDVTYRRRFCLPADWQGRKILLHFGAVDYACRVYVNGQCVGGHIGGNIGFALDITSALTWQEEEVCVEVHDPCTDETIPRGKQYWLAHPDSIWYRRTTGIWQSVWLEPVAESRIESLRYTADIDRGTVDIAYHCPHGAGAELHLGITLRGEPVADLGILLQEDRGHVTVDLMAGHIFRQGVHHAGWCWTPESPTLFDVTATLSRDGQVTDRVESYFGMRKIETRGGRVYLNNRPYYQRLVLDQGYWPDSLMTAPSDEALRRDIELAKEMGFNGCRKHQKAEDSRFLYWADRLGYLVWGEIGSCAAFSEEAARRLTEEWAEAITRDYNHPSIVAWVTVNESWGVPGAATDTQQQALMLALYYQAKTLDTTRLVVGNDGWEMARTDLCAIHNYNHGAPDDQQAHEAFARSLSTRDALLQSMPAARPIYADGYQNRGEPILLTEFGGISMRNDTEGAWGYTNAGSSEELLAEYRRILQAINDSQALYGFCYTQLCDVEQETNGLYTYDRRPKVAPDAIRRINESVKGF